MSGSRPEDSVPVWTPFTPRRAEHVLFRRRFSLAEVPELAEMHLFADHRYVLRVNGESIGYGPARFHPEFPEYDSYDLCAHLKAGVNEIVVQVVWPGIHTDVGAFHSPCFRAWGRLESKGKTLISLETPGGWQTRRDETYLDYGPRFAFALGPIEIVDQRLENPADIEWEDAQPVEDTWGALRPRSIPLLTQRLIQPEQITGIFKEKPTNWRLFSFVHTNPRIAHNRAHMGYGRRSKLYESRRYNLAWTWIRSEAPREINARTSWGEVFLNGNFLQKESRLQDAYRAETLIMPLRAGWNLLVVAIQLAEDTWDFNLALSGNPDILVSATKKVEAPNTFRVSTSLDKEEFSQIRLIGEPREPGVSGFQLESKLLQLSDGFANPNFHLSWLSFERLPESAPSLPQRCPPEETRLLVFDFGKTVSGRLRFKVNSDEGCQLDVGFADELIDGRPKVGGQDLLCPSMRFILRGGIQEIETHMPVGFRYVEISIKGWKTEARLEELGIIEQRYPAELAARFECSDARNCAIWAMSQDTAAVCAEDAYTDTPGRERTLHAIDILPGLAVWQFNTEDLALFTRSLRLFLQAPRSSEGWFQSVAPTIPEEKTYPDHTFSLLFSALWLAKIGHTQLLGESIQAFSPIMEALTSHIERGDGLIHHESANYVDAVTAGVRGCSTMLNAMTVMGWEALSELQQIAGSNAKFLSHSETLRKHLSERLWNPGLEAFSEGIEEGKMLNTCSVVTNAWVLLARATTPDQQEKVLNYIKQTINRLDWAHSEGRKGVSSPPNVFFILEALYLHGKVELAEHLMRATWGMMLDAGSANAWENMNTRASLCHGRAIAPAYHFITRTLGLDNSFVPGQSDASKLRIAPQSATLEWAKGRARHPLGWVEVSWQRREQDLLLYVKPPEGVEPIIEPRGMLAELNLVRVESDPTER
ncbi:MAG: family 78 glycoside hydrolase catalytic domain [Verrucomicrobiota bacterium]